MAASPSESVPDLPPGEKKPEYTGAMELRMLHCQARTVAHATPLDVLPRSNDVPSEWTPPRKPTYVPRFYVQECEKMEWAEFARGPVIIAFDMHNAIDLPEACKGFVEPGTERFVRKILVSDPDVANKLQKLGVPATPILFRRDVEDLAGLTVTTYAWHDEQQEASVSFAEANSSREESPVRPRAYAWYNSSDGSAGILALDAQTLRTTTSFPWGEYSLPEAYYLGRDPWSAAPAAIADVTGVANLAGRLHVGLVPSCES